MGIRLKIAIGFMLLTITVISLVTFWGAQSLGFTVDSSDFIYLEGINQSISKQLQGQQILLEKQLSETAEAINAIGLKALLSENKLKTFINNLENNLNLDYVDIYINQKSICNHTELSPSISEITTLKRISQSGPLSYSGYLFARNKLSNENPTEIVFATKPHLITKTSDIYCLFDKSGILSANGFLSDYSLKQLEEIKNSEGTKQLTINDELYRLRCFEIDSSQYLITGYSAHVATLARTEINSMMLRVALLEILGFLILGYFWAHQIFAPMQTLKSSIENVSRGEWQEIPQEITDNSYEEIGSVAKSFNEMLQQLTKARENLIEAQKQLASKEKMATLGRFSAGIAHEINNPLGTILMSAGMLNESVKNNIPIEKEDISTIIEEVKRCRDIIENLRIYTRKSKPNLVTRSLKDFFDNSQKAILEEFKDNADIFTFYSAFKEDTKLAIDTKAMQQVFNNLVKNAIEASSNNTKIKIIADSDENNCIIKIEDNGKGFECNPEHIFEPMFTTKAQGTGLGLVICQAIVEGHQGFIKAERVESEGITRFTISIPKAKTA